MENFTIKVATSPSTSTTIQDLSTTKYIRSKSINVPPIMGESASLQVPEIHYRLITQGG